MYHTEGYLDKETYFTKGHLWSNAIIHQGKVCYFWFVKDREAEVCAQMDIVIQEWMQRELVCALDKGHAAIGRELNRFGAKLNAGKMHLYYGQQFYSYGDEENFRSFAENGVWVYMSPDLGIVEGKCCAEYLGNQLKTVMLLAMSEGLMEQGYFLIWED